MHIYLLCNLQVKQFVGQRVHFVSRGGHHGPAVLGYSALVPRVMRAATKTYSAIEEQLY
jgi:hypothetical protein